MAKSDDTVAKSERSRRFFATVSSLLAIFGKSAVFFFFGTFCGQPKLKKDFGSRSQLYALSQQQCLASARTLVASGEGRKTAPLVLAFLQWVLRCVAGASPATCSPTCPARTAEGQNPKYIEKSKHKKSKNNLPPPGPAFPRPPAEGRKLEFGKKQQDNWKDALKDTS